MTTRSHPPGYHCSKALRRLGFDEHAIAKSLRRELALDTGEIEAALTHPITPPDGVPITVVEPMVDLTDRPMEQPRRRRSDLGPATT